MTSDRLVKAYLEKAKLRIKTRKPTLTTPSKKRGLFSRFVFPILVK